MDYSRTGVWVNEGVKDKEEPWKQKACAGGLFLMPLEIISAK